ncbi:hypothetical protein [Paenibacillus sp. NPDC058174]|uniref:hypothetical protein n=1 Tax=Paenibacillus sp. NPDC058174 TaxID=3346366 RepID=UPI0036DBBA20
MLAVKSATFIELVERKKLLEENKEQIQLFKTRHFELRNALIELAKIRSKYLLMRDAGIPCPKFGEILSPIEEIAKHKQQLFIENPQLVLEKTSFQTFIKAIITTVTSVCQGLLQEWKIYIEGLMPYIQQDTLNIFKKVPAFKRETELIEQHMASLRTHMNNLPIDSAEIEKLKEMSKVLHQLWKKFGQGDVPTEVLHFLRLAGSSTGAPLSILTEEILNWLNEHGIYNDCSIRI